MWCQDKLDKLTGGYLIAQKMFLTRSQASVLLNMHHQRDCSPPPATLSQTPSPIPMPSPSRRGATARDAGSSTSRDAQPPTPRLASELISEASSSHRDATGTRMVPASGDVSSSTSRSAQPPIPRLSATPTSEASPSRRGATTGSNAHRSICTRRSAASTSRTTRAAAAAPPPPPSQRQSEFSRITERFLRVEEQQLEIQQSNARILQALLEQTIERDRALSRAVAAIGEGLQSLAEATKSLRD